MSYSSTQGFTTGYPAELSFALPQLVIHQETQ